MIDKFSTILAAMVLGLSLTAGVASAGAVDDAIKARKACMKANGAAMGILVPMFQGAKPFDAAAIAAVVAVQDTACAGWATWWGPETAKGEVGFRAAGGSRPCTRSGRPGRGSRARPRLWNR